MAPGSGLRRLHLLGEGGAGRVWLAETPGGTRLALKEATATDPGTEIALRREYATLASLAHPNLVEAIAFARHPGSGAPQLVQELVEGIDVVAALAREGPPLFLGIAVEGLQPCYFCELQRGDIHRHWYNK